MALNINNIEIPITRDTKPVHIARQLAAGDPSIDVPRLADEIARRLGLDRPDRLIPPEAILTATISLARFKKHFSPRASVNVAFQQLRNGIGPAESHAQYVDFRQLRDDYRTASPARQAQLEEAMAEAAAPDIRKMAAAQGGSPGAFVGATLRFMADNMRYAGGDPRPRDPHEWPGGRALAHKTFNGCVEAAKAFKLLMNAAAPKVPCKYVGGTLRGEDGGHAIARVSPPGGASFLVDPTLCHFLESEQDTVDLARGQLTVNGPDRRADFQIRRVGRNYTAAQYEFSLGGDPSRQIGDPQVFDTAAEAKNWVRRKSGVFPSEKDGTFEGPGGKEYHIFLETDDPADYTIKEADAGRVAEHNAEMRLKE